MTTTLETSAAAVRNAIDRASKNLVERQALIETIALAAVAREHVLVVGPPGTAKSQAVRRMAQATGGRYFEYLIGRFTEPSEIFGPVDLRKLKEGVVETQTLGMLPEAEVAFLDEIFLGSTAILNTLLGLLQERVFRRGHSVVACPLRICVGATNKMPESDNLAAFADRFLVHVFTESIPDSRLEELLEGGWATDKTALTADATMGDIDALADLATSCDMSAVRGRLAHCIRKLRSAGLVLSDRRLVKTQRLIAAAAVLGGRTVPTEADLWAIILAIPSKEEQEAARECLSSILQPSENATLSYAAEDASLGPLARSTNIIKVARRLLNDGPGQHREEWLLSLEGIAREIDAGFAPGNLPVELKDVRAMLVEQLVDDEDKEKQTSST
jgi:MoxR-like ATPase